MMTTNGASQGIAASSLFQDFCHFHAGRLASPTFLVNQNVGQTRPEHVDAVQNRSMSERKCIGDRIRMARRAAGLTQAELAAAVGVVRSHLTNTENGKDNLALDKLLLIAQETNVSVTWLISGIEAQPSSQDPARSEWDAAYESLNEASRSAVMALIKTFLSVGDHPALPAAQAQAKKKPPEPVMA